MTRRRLEALYQATIADVLGRCEPTSYVYSKKFMCAVGSLDYAYARRVGVVFIEPNDCVDMSGCIGAFEAIDSGVEVIFTLHRCGGHVDCDTTYFRTRGEWVAIPPGSDWIRISGD